MMTRNFSLTQRLIAHIPWPRLMCLTVLLLCLLVWGNAQAGDPLQGAALYTQHCSGCHGGNGIGVIAGTPNFAGNTQLMVKPDFELMGTVMQGKGIMPAFQGKLTEIQVMDILAHVRTFF